MPDCEETALRICSLRLKAIIVGIKNKNILVFGGWSDVNLTINI